MERRWSPAGSTRRPSGAVCRPLTIQGGFVCAACAAHDRLVLTHDFSCAFRVSLFAWGVRTCALACAFWLWAFFGGPFHIRGIARIGEGLGYPRSSSDAKQAPLEPRKAPRISEKPLPGVRGGTEGNRGDPRMRQFSPARAQNPVRTEEPREAPRTSEESPTGGPTGNRGEAGGFPDSVPGPRTGSRPPRPQGVREGARAAPAAGGDAPGAPWAGGCTGTSPSIGTVGKGIAAFSGPKCTSGTVGAAPHGGEIRGYFRGRVSRPSPR